MGDRASRRYLSVLRVGQRRDDPCELQPESSNTDARDAPSEASPAARPLTPEPSHARMRTLPDAALVEPRVSHCELRDSEWSAVVGPAEGFGALVVGVDEFDDPVGEVVDGVELAVTDEAALHDREEQLDLVEP